MNYYLAYIKTRKAQYYELVKANTLAEASNKIEKYVTNAISIDIHETIE